MSGQANADPDQEIDDFAANKDTERAGIQKISEFYD